MATAGEGLLPKTCTVTQYSVTEVVIFEPQEPQKDKVIITDCETVKHLLHIRCECNSLPCESEEGLQEEYY